MGHVAAGAPRVIMTRMIERVVAIVLGIALTQAACGSDRCETAADCVSPAMCGGDGKCFSVPPAIGGDGGRGDARVPGADADVPEADAGAEAGVPDAGDAEAGVPDAGDGGTGVPDAGDAGDAGPLPMAPDSRGFVWAGEIRDGPMTYYHAYGELLDHSTATYTSTRQVYPDFEGGECVLTSERLTAGAPTGYSTNSLTIAHGAPRPPSSSFAYFPVMGRVGYFEPIGALPMEMFSGSNGVLFGLDGIAGPMAVGTTSLVMSAAPPIIFEILPTAGSILQLETIPPLTWGNSGEPMDRVTIEIYDENREVVLTCITGNDNAYTIPQEAKNQFRMVGPTGTMHMDIRHDREVTATANTTTRSFDVLFRASWGARFLVL